jgi:hypothetical protein
MAESVEEILGRLPELITFADVIDLVTVDVDSEYTPLPTSWPARLKLATYRHNPANGLEHVAHMQRLRKQHQLVLSGKKAAHFIEYIINCNAKHETTMVACDANGEQQWHDEAHTVPVQRQVAHVYTWELPVLGILAHCLSEAEYHALGLKFYLGKFMDRARHAELFRQLEPYRAGEDVLTCNHKDECRSCGTGLASIRALQDVYHEGAGAPDGHDAQAAGVPGPGP